MIVKKMDKHSKHLNGKSPQSGKIQYPRSMSVSSYNIPTATGQHRTFLTVCMYFCFIALGLVGSVMGPTLVHMQHLLDTDLESLTLTFTYQRVGYLVGVAISGFLFDRLNQEIQFAIACLIEGTATALAPWMPSLYGYYGAMAVQSLAHGYINTGGQSFMIGLWESRKYKQPVIQGGNAMWSLGASICPFIVSPFLVDLPSHFQSSLTTVSSDLVESVNMTTTGNFNESRLLLNGSDGGTTVQTLANISNVRYAYFIIGMCIAVISVLFFIAFFLHGAKCENEGVKFTQEKPKLHGDHFSFKIPMLVMLFFFFVFYIWYEGVPGGLLSAFVIQGLHWSVNKGPLITSVYYGAHGIGRVLGIPISMCLSAGTMLVCNLTLTMAAFIVMYFAPMADTDIFMWLATAMAGFSMSTTFACMLLWVSNHMTITGAAGSVFLMGTSTGGMTGAALVGHLFQRYTHMWVVYLSLAACAAHVVLFTIMYFFAYFHKRKTQHRKQQQKPNNGSNSIHRSPIVRNSHALNNNGSLKLNNFEAGDLSSLDRLSCTPLKGNDSDTISESVSSDFACVHNTMYCNCFNIQLRQASNMM